MSTLMNETTAQELEDDVRNYSILVGFLLVVVFVAPCITLALMAKCFQKQSTGRKFSASTAGGTFKYVEERYDTTVPDSDTSGFGAFGMIEISAKKLECIEKTVALKHPINCIETWKSYAPPLLFGGSEDCKKLVAALKTGTVSASSTSGGGKTENHSNCLKFELNYLSRIPSHHSILNLLGVCRPSSSGNPTALLLEYPLYGSLYAFLVCKRLGRISNNAKGWAGTDNQNLEDTILRALPDENRQFLSSLLDDYKVRSRPFLAPLNEEFSDIDLLLFALQIANGMQFLAESGIHHRNLASDNIVVSVSFFLKLSCLSPDSNFPIHKRVNASQTRRTTSGRNMVKWEAPEVIDGSGDTTEQSNVWRYGMTLWEISSLGDAPYAEIPGKSLVEQMKKGEIPHCPQRCCGDYYAIMKRCWQIDISLRPTFDGILRIITSQLQSKEDETLLSESDAKPEIRFKRRPSQIRSSVDLSSPGCESDLGLIVRGADTPTSIGSGYEETDV